MPEITAQLSNYRQSPRKVRLVADLVRGKRVSEAFTQLSFLNKRAAEPMKKFIASAVANAEHNFKAKKEDLVIKTIEVNQGSVMKRFMPRAFGRAGAIRKKMSHISLVLVAPDAAVSEKKRTPRAKKAAEKKSE